MNIKPLKKYGIVVIDNFYNQDELEKIWIDISIIEDKKLLKSPKDTGGARNYATGSFIKNNHGTYLDSLHDEKIIQHILPLSEKFFLPEITSAIEDLGSMYKLWSQINYTGNLISYYENNDFYDAHIDQSVFTVLLWLYREPKLWEGGILKFPEINVEVETKYNRAIIFPSCFLHEVTPVKMLENIPGSGRFTITHFGFIRPKF